MANILNLIDGEEVLYKMREILPDSESTEWYENAKPKEMKELVDELYNIVLDQPTVETQQTNNKRECELKPYYPDHNGDSTEFICSNCSGITKLPYKDYACEEYEYCPHCGAVNKYRDF